MNSAEITRSRSALAEHFELLEMDDDTPAIPEVTESETAGADLSDETKSGFVRFAEFLKAEKTKMKSGDRKRDRAIQAYETAKKFNEEIALGQVLDQAA